MKKKSYKLAKLERERYSVFFDDLKTCMNCGSTREMTKHEIFEGSKRINSMKYGFVLPLCLRCHRRLQEDKEFNLKWKKKVGAEDIPDVLIARRPDGSYAPMSLTELRRYTQMFSVFLGKEFIIC